MPEPTEDRTQVFVGYLLKAESQLYAFIRAQVFDRNDADDLFQDVAKVLWQKFGEFQEGTNFAAWAIQVARHKLLHYFADRQRQRRMFSEDVLELIAQKSQELSGEVPDMRRALDLCMEKLPAKDREVVRHCYEPGETINAAAAKLGRPFDTIKSVLKRSRRALLECIQRTLASEAR